VGTTLFDLFDLFWLKGGFKEWVGRRMGGWREWWVVCEVWVDRWDGWEVCDSV
jgi:hypothetical protein